MPDGLLPSPSARRPDPAAINAYALAARRVALHGVDIVDAPARRRHIPTAVPIPAPRAEATLTHTVRSPTGTAFKLGFGFAAGAFALRAIVLAIAGLVLFATVNKLLGALVG